MDTWKCRIDTKVESEPRDNVFKENLGTMPEEEMTFLLLERFTVPCFHKQHRGT